MAHSKEKKETQLLDLLDKDFKSTVLNILKCLIETMGKEVKKTRKMIQEQNENINKTQII